MDSPKLKLEVANVFQQILNEVSQPILPFQDLLIKVWNTGNTIVTPGLPICVLFQTSNSGEKIARVFAYYPPNTRLYFNGILLNYPNGIFTSTTFLHNSRHEPLHGMIEHVIYPYQAYPLHDISPHTLPQIAGKPLVDNLFITYIEEYIKDLRRK